MRLHTLFFKTATLKGVLPPFREMQDVFVDGCCCGAFTVFFLTFVFTRSVYLHVSCFLIDVLSAQRFKDGKSSGGGACQICSTSAEAS